MLAAYPYVLLPDAARAARGFGSLGSVPSWLSAPRHRGHRQPPSVVRPTQSGMSGPPALRLAFPEGASAVPLLTRVGRGDPLAVRECIDQYERLVWSLARRYSRTREDAEDAAQEAFVALWSSAGRYDPARGSEAYFVALIVRRRMIERLRAQGRTPRVEPIEEADAVASEGHPDRAVEASLACREVAKLPPAEQTILLLSTRDGLTHEEIASRVGMPLGSVKTHLSRAIRRLRAALLGGTSEPAASPATSKEAL